LSDESGGMVPLLDPCQCKGLGHRDEVTPPEPEPEPAAAVAAAAAPAAAAAGVAAAATTVAAPPKAAVLPQHLPGLCPRDSWNELDFAPADLLAVARMAGLGNADATVSEGEGSWCSNKRSEQETSRSMTDLDDFPACLSHAAVFCDNVLIGELAPPSVQPSKIKAHALRHQLDDVTKDLLQVQQELDKERAYRDRARRPEGAILQVSEQLEERDWHSQERASWIEL